jgi:hypothetical protein
MNQNPCYKKTNRYREPTKPTTKKTKATKQSQSKPKLTETQTKNLEGNFSDSTNQPELLLPKETLTNERAKHIKHKLKRRRKPIKDESGKREHKSQKEKQTQSTKQTCQKRICNFGEAAQRFALPAGGRDEIRFGRRKNSKPENYSKMPQNPTSRVHALLGGVLLCKTR